MCKTRKSALKKLRGWIIAAGVLALVFAALRYGLPLAICMVHYPEVNIDLSEKLAGAPEGLFPDKTLAMRYGISRRDGGGFTVSAKGRIVGWPFTATADIVPSFSFRRGFRASGEAAFRLDGSALGGTAKFEAAAPGGWSAKIEVPQFALTNEDPFLAALLSRHPQRDVRGLAFDGKALFEANASQTNLLFSVPVWDAMCRISALDVTVPSGDKDIAVGNLRTRIGARGIAGHVDMDPMFLHADAIEGAGCVLSNAFASVRATETAFLVTEAGAKFCDGDIRLYAFFLDLQRLNAGVTIYIDGLDAGQALSHLNGFKGEASGKLTGKLPVTLENGDEIRLKKGGYLHSVPGEKGKLKIYDPSPVADNLLMMGVGEEAVDNISKALADLDYTVLRADIIPEEGETMALALRLEGTSTRGGATVPVSLNVTFHGNFEQLINTGLKAAKKAKENK